MAWNSELCSAFKGSLRLNRKKKRIEHALLLLIFSWVTWTRTQIHIARITKKNRFLIFNFDEQLHFMPDKCAIPSSLHQIAKKKKIARKVTRKRMRSDLIALKFEMSEEKFISIVNNGFGTNSLVMPVFFVFFSKTTRNKLDQKFDFFVEKVSCVASNWPSVWVWAAAVTAAHGVCKCNVYTYTCF